MIDGMDGLFFFLFLFFLLFEPRRWIDNGTELCLLLLELCC